jgi:hypothetical protein
VVDEQSDFDFLVIERKVPDGFADGSLGRLLVPASVPFT